MSAAEPSCFVCDKHAGRVDVPGGALYEDERVYASHGIIPEGRSRTYLGTLFVEPKRHVPGIAELDEHEARQIGLVSSRLARALKQSEGAEHVYVFVLGHHVDHLHVWLVPRYPGTPPEYAPMRLAEWPDAPKGDPAQIAALCARVRAKLVP
ncbi:MAG: HIT domain-containing protein [Myxococcota bacterium]